MPPIASAAIVASIIPDFILIVEVFWGGLKMLLFIVPEPMLILYIVVVGFLPFLHFRMGI
jgi:hypothetical protein